MLGMRLRVLIPVIVSILILGTFGLGYVFAQIHTDFSIDCSPNNILVEQGSSTSSTCVIMSLNGFGSPVNLSCSNLPAGITCNFDPNPIIPPIDGVSQSLLTIAVDEVTNPGDYSIQVVGASNDPSLIKEQTLMISVFPKDECKCARKAADIFVPDAQDKKLLFPTDAKIKTQVKPRGVLVTIDVPWVSRMICDKLVEKTSCNSKTILKVSSTDWRAGGMAATPTEEKIEGNIDAKKPSSEVPCEAPCDRKFHDKNHIARYTAFFENKALPLTGKVTIEWEPQCPGGFIRGHTMIILLDSDIKGGIDKENSDYDGNSTPNKDDPSPYGVYK